jgi:hypothetical protein
MHARRRGMDAYQIVNPWEQRRAQRNYHDAEQFGIQVPHLLGSARDRTWRGHSFSRRNRGTSWPTR